MWLYKRSNDLEDFRKAAEEANLSEKDYKQSLIAALEQDGESVDPDIIVAEISEARRLVTTTKFNKQEYLIQNLEDLADLSKRRFLTEEDATDATGNKQKVGLTQNRVCRFEESSKNAINKISGLSDAKALFNATTEDLSKLVPRIRIFKVKYDKERNLVGETEIKFPTETQVTNQIFDYNPNFASYFKTEADPKSFFKTRRDYGIKNFSWQYNGSDPFSVDRDIEATLELYFQDFAQFTALRGLKKKENTKKKGKKSIDTL